jgi:hypothetical protein
MRPTLAKAYSRGVSCHPVRNGKPQSTDTKFVIVDELDPSQCAYTESRKIRHREDQAIEALGRAWTRAGQDPRSRKSFGPFTDARPRFVDFDCDLRCVSDLVEILAMPARVALRTPKNGFRSF